MHGAAAVTVPIMEPDNGMVLQIVHDGDSRDSSLPTQVCEGKPVQRNDRCEQQEFGRVDAVSGALMLLPRSLFERIGGFDEGYRLHAEDLDFCRRVRDAGATVACANDITVTHVRGVSSRSRPLFVEWHKHRGLVRYYRKFDAPDDGVFTRIAVFAMVWGRFPFAAAKALLGR